MNNAIFTNGLRFIGLLLLQVLVFQGFSMSFTYIHIIIYPIFILLLPIQTPRTLAILLGFLMGIGVDIFYGSLGVHASATVFTAFIRPSVMSVLEPRGGYNVNFSPTKRRMGLEWFIQYSGILMFIHLFFYFSVEAFTFFYIGSILLKTAISFVLSMIFIIMYQYIFNPLD